MPPPFSVPPASAAPVPSPSLIPKPLARPITANQTGDITSTGALNVSSGNAIGVTGNNATIINADTIDETKTSRDIRDSSSAITGLVVTNTTGGIMETNDADIIQMQNAGSTVTLNNYGQMLSLSSTDSGGQAVDFAAVTGANVVNNFAGALLRSDAPVRASRRGRHHL